MKFRLFKMISCLGILTSLSISSSNLEGVLASVKATGMAATMIAYPQDAFVGAFNPAGMADVGDRLDVEFAWDHASRRTVISGNQFPLVGINGDFDAGRKKNFYVGNFAINKELPFCDLTIGCVPLEFSAGLVVYNRNFNKTSYKVPIPVLGRRKVGMEYCHEVAAACFTVKAWDRINFGLSINYNYQRLKVGGLQNIALNPLTGTSLSLFPNNVANRRYSYSQGVGYTLGARIQLLDWVSVGATWQPRTNMSRFKKYKGFLAEHGKLDIPQKVGAGIAIRFLPCATLAFDVEHIRWRRIRSLHNPVLPNLNVAKLGSSGGAGFGFRSQWFYRVGVDWDVFNCLTVRMGYRHAKSPIRSSQTAVNLLIVDTVQNFITGGFTWRINCCNEISMFYAYGFHHKIKGQNTIPALLGGGNVELKESDQALGIAWGWNY